MRKRTIWFCSVPVSERTLGNMMPNLSVKYNLSKQYTNHCVRVTIIQILDDSNYEGTDVQGKRFVYQFQGEADKNHTSYWTQECRIREELHKKAVNVKEKENSLHFIGAS